MVFRECKFLKASGDTVATSEREPYVEETNFEQKLKDEFSEHNIGTDYEYQTDYSYTTENNLQIESTTNSVTNEECNGNFPILCKLWLELKNLFSSKNSGASNQNDESTNPEECNGHFSALCSLWMEIKKLFEQNQINFDGELTKE